MVDGSNSASSYISKNLCVCFIPLVTTRFLWFWYMRSLQGHAGFLSSALAKVTGAAVKVSGSWFLELWRFSRAGSLN